MCVLLQAICCIDKFEFFFTYYSYVICNHSLHCNNVHLNKIWCGIYFTQWFQEQHHLFLFMMLNHLTVEDRKAWKKNLPTFW